MGDLGTRLSSASLAFSFVSFYTPSVVWLQHLFNMRDPAKKPVSFIYALRGPLHSINFFSFDKCVIRGSPIGFFYPVIPTQIFGQSRNPEGYFWHPTSRAYFQSRISPRFPFKIPNPEPQIRQIPHPEKLIGDPLIRLSLRKQPTFGDATTGFPAK